MSILAKIFPSAEPASVCDSSCRAAAIRGRALDRAMLSGRPVA